eukprot:Anaeramoba_ignava/a482504_22.p5 GENE.a482504_22~~a482504_22.p5  ORF type:complete len:143 (+),score=5.17 a482504_22:255-683(+)
MDIYIVRPGDTLSHIANFCGLSLDELLKINPQIDNPGLIFPGQEINIKETVTDDDFVPPEIPESDAPWFKIALEEMWAGVTEIRGRKHNPRIIEYHKSTTLRASNDETAWCSSFVNWCIEQAGLKGTDSAAARSWLKWGKKT